MVEHLVFVNIGLFRPTTSKRHTGQELAVDLANWEPYNLGGVSLSVTTGVVDGGNCFSCFSY